MKRWGGLVAGCVVAVLLVIAWRRGGPSFVRKDASVEPGAKQKLKGGEAFLGAPPRTDPCTQRRGSLAGTIRSEVGAPIHQARVCASIKDDQLPTELTREATCATTDANGRYILENLVSTEYSVAAGAKGYLPETFPAAGHPRGKPLLLAPGEKITGVDLILRSGGAELTGVVSDISGGPIAHAKVWAVEGSGGPGDTGGSSPLTETDAQGAFALSVAPGRVQVFATADGYGSTSVAGRAPGDLTLVLTPESSLSGLVVEAGSGRPMAGAKVTVATSALGQADELGIDLSDAKGKFRVTRLSPGRYTVTATMEHGYGVAEGSVLVGLGQTVEGVVVRVFKSVKIVGRVMLAGKPPSVCVVASVGFTDKAHHRQVRAHTEADGTLIAEGVLPGTYSVEPWCEGALAHESYENIVVTDKDILGLTWQVENGATIAGKVFTEEGHPVGGAVVSGQTMGGDPRSPMAAANDRSLPDGTYALSGLPPGTYKLDVISNDGAAPLAGYTVAVAAGQTVEKNLVLLAGGALKGTIRDTAGAPVVGATIDVVPVIEAAPYGGDGLRSDAQGAFALAALRPGEYRVIARRGWAPLKSPGTTDDAPHGEKVIIRAGEIANVQLVVVAEALSIKGSVVAADNEPVADAFVVAGRESDAAGAQNFAVYGTREEWTEGSADKPVLTSVDGTFAIPKLIPGKYTLRAYRKGGGEAILEHAAAGSTVKLEIKETGSLAGQATREGGAVEELRIEVEDPKTGFARSETFFRTGGRFALSDLPAGHFYLTASSEGSQKKIELDLALAEKKTGVALQLEPLVTITGRIIDHFSRAPIAGIRTMAAYTNGGNLGFEWGRDDEQRANISDEKGRFTIQNAPRGKIQIICSPREPTSDYMDAGFFRSIEGTGTVDVGDLSIIKKRVKPGEPIGESGIRAAEMAPNTRPEDYRVEVSFIDPSGPARGTDLKVGDIINTIDGVDVTGSNWPRMWPLITAPTGTKLTLGLARGATVVIVLGPPR